MAKKVVLVTGASRGIGKAIAVKFAKKGYNIIINCAHREQELMQTKKEIESYQVTCTAFLGDMGDMSVCEQMFSMIRKQFVLSGCTCQQCRDRLHRPSSGHVFGRLGPHPAHQSDFRL
ncbi:MAG: SDR family NAD(P)-dependent oxidoreductase [Clostridium sp.]